MLAIIKNICSICFLKTKITINSFKTKFNNTKLFGLLIAAFVCIWAIADFSSDISSKLLIMPFGKEITQLFFTAIVITVSFITFTGDISMGHSIGTGQLSKDFTYLRSLPISPICLIITKLYERLLSDYFGMLVLFSTFAGIILRNKFHISGLILAFVLFIQFSLFIGLIINILMIVCSHFLKKTTTENIFSVIGYISAFSILLPFISFNNNPQKTLNTIALYIEKLPDFVEILLTPFVWVANCLINGKFGIEYINFTICWFILMTLGSFIYFLAVKNNWFNYIGSIQHSIPLNKTYNNLLKGIMWKEIKLLKSDVNMLLNAIILPITIIIVEIYAMKNSFSFNTINSIQNLISGSIIYFCMFGPINSIGGEGKSINIIETLPISCKTFILKKFYVWLLIAECIFIPTEITTLYTLNFPLFIIIKSTLFTAAFTALCIFGAICISAISANYEAKSFPQRSTFLGKISIMSLLLVLIPVKTISILDLLSFIFFIILLTLTWKKSIFTLKYRLDLNYCFHKTSILDIWIIIVSYFASTVTIIHFFEALIPGTDTEHWPYSIPAVFLLPILIMNLFSLNTNRKNYDFSLSKNSKS